MNENRLQFSLIPNAGPTVSLCAFCSTTQTQTLALEELWCNFVAWTQHRGKVTLHLLGVLIIAKIQDIKVCEQQSQKSSVKKHNLCPPYLQLPLFLFGSHFSSERTHNALLRTAESFPFCSKSIFAWCEGCLAKYPSCTCHRSPLWKWSVLIEEC